MERFENDRQIAAFLSNLKLLRSVREISEPLSALRGTALGLCSQFHVKIMQELALNRPILAPVGFKGLHSSLKSLAREIQSLNSVSHYSLPTISYHSAPVLSLLNTELDFGRHDYAIIGLKWEQPLLEEGIRILRKITENKGLNIEAVQFTNGILYSQLIKCEERWMIEDEAISSNPCSLFEALKALIFRNMYPSSIILKKGNHFQLVDFALLSEIAHIVDQEIKFTYKSKPAKTQKIRTQSETSAQIIRNWQCTNCQRYIKVESY